MTAYEGREPYVFVSYAHKDSERVMPIIEALSKEGYLVWYDGGIEAGSEWPKTIAEHLRGCSCMIAFVSHAYVKSDNCLRELTYAQNHNKPILSAFIDIEWSQLPIGIDMQLGLCQSILRTNHESEKSFINAITCAPFFADSGCSPNMIPSKGDDTPAVSAQIKAKKSAATEKDSEDDGAPPTKLKKTLNLIFVLFELAYAYFCIDVNNYMVPTARDIFITSIVRMILPHAVIVVIGAVIMKTIGKRLSDKECSDITVNCIIFRMLTAIIGFVCGLFLLPSSFGFFARLATAFLVNVLCAIVDFFTFLMYDRW